MNDWTNESLNERLKKLIIEWTNEQVNHLMSERMQRRTITSQWLFTRTSKPSKASSKPSKKCARRSGSRGLAGGLKCDVNSFINNDSLFSKIEQSTRGVFNTSTLHDEFHPISPLPPLPVCYLSLQMCPNKFNFLSLILCMIFLLLPIPFLISSFVIFVAILHLEFFGNEWVNEWWNDYFNNWRKIEIVNLQTRNAGILISWVNKCLVSDLGD